MNLAPTPDSAHPASAQPLKNLARVRFGVTIRGGNSGAGLLKHQLRLADFTDSREIRLGALNLVSTDTFDFEQHRLRREDIVLCNRESRFVANLVMDDLDAFAGSQMVVISLNNPAQLLPRYFLWWLNQPDTAKLVASKASGAYNRVVPTSAIRELMVPLPHVDTQNRIILIEGLILEECKIMQELGERRAQLASFVIKKTLQSA